MNEPISAIESLSVGRDRRWRCADGPGAPSRQELTAVGQQVREVRGRHRAWRTVIPTSAATGKARATRCPGGNIGKDLPGLKLPLTPAGEAALQHNLTATIDPESALHHRRHPAPQRQRPAVRGAAGRQARSRSCISTATSGSSRSTAASTPTIPIRRSSAKKSASGKATRWSSIRSAFKDEKVWIDENANPHSDALHVVERWTRPDMDHIHVRHADRGSEVLHAAVHLRADVGAREAGRAVAGILLQREQRRPGSPGIRSGSDSAGRHARLSRPGAAAAAADARRSGEKIAREPLRRTSAISSAPCRAGRPRSIRAAGITSAHAARRCWLATTSTRPASWPRESLRDREPTMWRYREMLPLFPGRVARHARRRLHAARARARARVPRLGLDRLYIKDESLNPTNSFKARGQSAAITRARGLGVTTVSVPSAGNAGNAMAAYAARAGLHAKVFLPRDVKVAVRARVPAVRRGRDAGRRPDHGRRPCRRRTGRAARLVRRLDAQGAVPDRRQEDDGVRDRRADGLDVPRLDHLSDGRRHRHSSACGRRSTSWSGSAGCSRSAGRAWCRCRPTAARRLSARSTRARRRRRCGKAPAPWPTACACRARSATS